MSFVPESQDGTWSSWESWGDCSKTCGGGVKIRSRLCGDNATTRMFCLGTNEQMDICNLFPCNGKYSLHISLIYKETANSFQCFFMFESIDNVSDIKFVMVKVISFSIF